MHTFNLIPRSFQSVQPFSQKSVTCPFWALINKILLAKIARAPHSIFMAHLWGKTGESNVILFDRQSMSPILVWHSDINVAPAP